jgi:hypothetical protein
MGRGCWRFGRCGEEDRLGRGMGPDLRGEEESARREGGGGGRIIVGKSNVDYYRIEGTIGLSSK